MDVSPAADRAPTILIVGASRGLGHAMADGFAGRGWRVIGTVRGDRRTPLHDLADAHDPIEIETLDMRDDGQIAALADRLSDRQLDILFVNAGIANRDPNQPIGDVQADDFAALMLTNVLAPMRVIETLADRVPPTGLIGVMSSGQGSITNNLVGQREAYRCSKAALNMAMRSFAARAAQASRPIAVMAPGWIRTALGGPQAPLAIEDSIPRLVEVLIAKCDRPGIEYLDYLGRTVPW